MIDDATKSGGTDPDVTSLPSLRVEKLNLTTRAHNCLKKAGITLVSDLVQKTPHELLAIRNMGKGSIKAIERTLQDMALCLGMKKMDIAEWHRTIAALESGGKSHFRNLVVTPLSPKSDDTVAAIDSNIIIPDSARSSRKITEEEAIFASLAALPIDELNLDARAYNCLLKAEINLVGDLVPKTEFELRAIRDMGEKSIRVITQALREQGLRLGMKNTPPSNTRKIREFNAFIKTLELLRQNGIDDIGTLVDRTHDEMPVATGLDRNSIKLLENGLRKWGLHLRLNPKLVWCHDAKSFKDELLYAIPRLLFDVRPCLPLCFIAYHGINGEANLTLQKIGENSKEHGFDHAVTRERVRQVLVAAERNLRKNARRVRFSHWVTAVDEAKRHVPSLVHSFVSRFGYESASGPRDTYKMLERCAEIFELDFPFAMKAINGVGSLVVNNSDEKVFGSLSRLSEVTGGPYSELAETVKRLDCDLDVLQKTIEISSRWEFLDEARRYFWKRPPLPPQDYSKSGNSLLTSLCKVFSVTNHAKTSDLVSSIARERMLRLGKPISDIPPFVLEGIANRSGLFTVHDGEIRRKPEFEWCSVSRRDIMLLKICVERGRVVSSRLLYPGLVRAGLTKENASVTVAYSPFLVHTRSGLGVKEGIYKFVPRPQDINLDFLKARIGDAGDKDDLEYTRTVSGSAASSAGLTIPISARARLSGTYYAPDPIGLDGEWQVQATNGDAIGQITISGRLVVGLRPVISSLGLSKNELLELRPIDKTRTLVAHP